jgi:arginase family enzyme
MTHFYVISALGFDLVSDWTDAHHDEADRTRLYRIIHGLVAMRACGRSEKQPNPESS